MEFVDQIIEKAKRLCKTIIFPESTDVRTLEAVAFVVKNKIATATLIGNRKKIGELYPLTEIQDVKIIDPENFSHMHEYVDELVSLRKHKGIDAEQAGTLFKNPLYLGAMVLRMGGADGMVAGAANKTDDVLRAAFQIVQTAPGIKNASSAYIMCLPKPQFGEKGVLLFADCAITPDPSPETLADIAQASAQTARNLLGIEPRVALLSFSTRGSARHPMVDKITQALEIIRARGLRFQIDGEMQADAALVAEVAKIKCPGSEVAGRANVLIFPDLNSANIAYKLVQRLAGADAIGAVTQGLAKPVNDLSRGCSVKDIVNITAITASQANSRKTRLL